ncbi:beta-N-acetylhexosaminidase [Curvivirga aplysinae]|uniref:beta-N-acetylhexosaminidase n=1 Tax=Curvivirga aplysinae TaxID=2529852 RepID=UPI0012BC8CE5|nr:beta-N-acetylhexosaminidase [Curvivirga aplysinae]MTI10699.1 beta-N-acetylhexosaminidase [Curvivirga aplysinae]
MRNAAIFGCEGLTLTTEEISFFKDVQPFGFILFARNVDTPAQVKKICDSLRDIVNDPDAPILIDQEGGRVRRLRPPHWVDSFPMELFGNLYEKDKEVGIEALKLQCDLQSSQLLASGINVTCAPCLDVRFKDAHDIIGDRSFSTDPEVVGELGKIASDQFIKNGVYSIVKHIPGHGRAYADSHLELPVVEASVGSLRDIDFKPFITVKDAPMAMTAHILYPAFDKDNCATMSSTFIEDVIRKEIGFDGLIMTDDLSMKALSGDFTEKTKLCLDAGCDLILHCNGDMSEMNDISKSLKVMNNLSWSRWESAKLRLGDGFKLLTRYEEETASEKLRELLL